MMSDVLSADLIRIASSARTFLEQYWPEWHLARGRSAPEPLSSGTCQTSSLFLSEILVRLGFQAKVLQGTNPTKEEGYYHQGSWHGHAWVEASGYIVGITADQFGQSTTIVVKTGFKFYRAGEDTASITAKQQRITLVNAALEYWP